MRGKDRFFLGLLAAVLVLLTGSALLRPDRVLGNFGDIYAYHWPLQHLTAASLQSGSLPFWNPYIFAGLPHLANSQSAVFYPPAILLRAFPIGYGFTLYLLGHLLWAALGMTLWVRARRLDAAWACAAAAAFCLSPFLVYRIPQGIPTHLAVLAFVPWCWLAFESARPGLLGAVWALQFLAGHPQFALINAAGMFLWLLASPDRGRRAVVFFREGAVSAGLCLFQAFPLAEFLSRSNRAGIPPEFAAAYSMPPSALAALLRPSFAGDPIRGDFASVPSVFFESYALYVGWLPLGLALYALWRAVSGGPKRAAAGWALAAVGAFLACGRFNPLIDRLQELPVAGLSRVPARFGLLVIWGLLLSAGAGWSVLRESVKIGPRLKAAALALLFLDLGLWAGRFVYAQDPEPFVAPQPGMIIHLAGRGVRFATGDDLSNPNKAMLYRAMNVNGYDAFFLDSYTRYAARSEGHPAADPSRSYIHETATPEMRRLGVRYRLTGEAHVGKSVVIAGRTLLYDSPGAHPLAYILSDAAAAGFASGGLTAIENPAAERWTLRGAVPASAGAARLVLAVPKFPGWRAWLDGRPARVALEDGLTQSVSLAGLAPGLPFRVDFRFSPTAWGWLAAAAAAAWLAWLAQAAGRLSMARVLKGLPVALAAGVGGGLCYLAFRDVHLGKVLGALNDFQPAWTPLLLALPVLDLGIRAVRWRILLAPVVDAPRWALFKIEAVGLALNNVLFLRVGEFARALVGARELDVPAASVFATIVVERLCDTAALLGIFSACALARPDLVGSTLRFWALAATFGCVFGLAAIALGGERLRRAPLFTRIEAFPKAARLAEELIRGSRGMRSGAAAAAVAALSVALWLCDAGLYWAAARAMVFSPSLGYAQSVVVLATAGAASALPAVPGAFGNFEASVKVLLEHFGYAKELGLSYAAFVHLIMYAVVTSLGIVFFYRLGHTFAGLKGALLRGKS